MKAFADYVTKVQKLLLDKSYMTEPSDAESALATAVDTLAQYRLNISVQEYTGTGNRLYTLPTTWDNERGKYDVEYPVSDTAGEVQYLDVEMTEIYQVPIATDPTGFMLRFRDKGDVSSGVFLPPNGDLFRFHFGVPYQCVDAIVTIPDSLFEAVSKLGARELCLILASRLGQNANMINAGGVVDFQNPTNTFQKLADVFFKDFLRRVSPAKGEQPGRVVFGSFEETPLHRYARTLFPRDNSLRAYTDR